MYNQILKHAQQSLRLANNGVRDVPYIHAVQSPYQSIGI